MRKLLVIIGREYTTRVKTKFFLVSTILMPLFLVLTGVLPGLLISMKHGESLRLAVLDETGRLYEPVRAALTTGRGREGGGEARGAAATRGMPGADRSEQVREVGRALGARYEVEQAQAGGRAIDEVKAELKARVLRDELDGYIILPRDALETYRAEYHAENQGDIITREQIGGSLTQALAEVRMREANIDPAQVREMTRRVDLKRIKVSESGEERDTGGSFGLAMGVGIFIYAALLLYGQIILQSVVEEKTTRISEVLFSSVNAFQLMMGKLVGVTLVGLTQIAIWGAALVGFTAYGAAVLAAGGVDFALPAVPASLLIYSLFFFVVGFLTHAAIFVLVGAMVSSEKEAGQMAMPVIFVSVISAYLIFPVIRSPNSTFSFWVSVAPLFSPVTMLVRIATETPPFWQIALSLAVNVAATVGLTWVAARVYRTGMLMYGKSASIPEMLRWVRRA